MKIKILASAAMGGVLPVPDKENNGQIKILLPNSFPTVDLAPMERNIIPLHWQFCPVYFNSLQPFLQPIHLPKQSSQGFICHGFLIENNQVSIILQNVGSSSIPISAGLHICNACIIIPQDTSIVEYGED